MMTIVYTIGNTNLKTVENVARAMRDRLIIAQNIQIDKLVIFNTPSVQIEDQIIIYRRHLGEIRVEEFGISPEGFIIGKNIVSVFNEQGRKIIDLTNGLKTTSAGLYSIGSLLGIDEIYYLTLLVPITELHSDFSSDVHYRYIKVQRLSNISYLTRISHFDLIYYIEELNALIPNNDQSFLSKTKKNIIHGIHSYFERESYRSCISDCTIFAEKIIDEFHRFICEFEACKTYCMKNNILMYRQKDKLGASTYFFNDFSKNPTNNSDVSPLILLPGILSCIRHYRNICSHASMNGYEFSSGEARIVINLSIEALRRCKDSLVFWNKLSSI
jgi:hypothetical protein